MGNVLEEKEVTVTTSSYAHAICICCDLFRTKISVVTLYNYIAKLYLLIVSRGDIYVLVTFLAKLSQSRILC